MVKCVFVSALLFLAGCSSVDIKEFQNEKPTLKLEQYFNGTLEAQGIFKDRKGAVKKRFTCLIEASWKDGVGTLDEKFTYSDGTTSRRVWTLRKTAENKYVGTAGDVIGESEGEVAGNAFRMKYNLSLDVDGSNYHVSFDDWMYLVDDRVMLSHSFMSKWGFRLGEVILSFQKK